MDPGGMVLAGSRLGVHNRPLMVDIDLDNRPRYHEWPEEIRRGPVISPRPARYGRRGGGR